MNLYHYHSNHLIILPIPQLFSSIHLSKHLHPNHLYHQLVIQLFNFFTQ
ncbi:YueH family protein, partial [Staphylococcus epidermidis]